MEAGVCARSRLRPGGRGDGAPKTQVPLVLQIFGHEFACAAIGCQLQAEALRRICIPPEAGDRHLPQLFLPTIAIHAADRVHCPILFVVSLQHIKSGYLRLIQKPFFYVTAKHTVQSMRKPISNHRNCKVYKPLKCRRKTLTGTFAQYPCEASWRAFSI